VPANLGAALTTVVRIRGIRGGRGRRAYFGAPCQEAGAKVLAALPKSPETRRLCVAAGSAPVEQVRAATAPEARVGRLRKHVPRRRAPAPKRPGKRGRPARPGPVRHPGARHPEGRPDEDPTGPIADRVGRGRRWRNLHFRATPRTLFAVGRVDEPASKRPLLLGTTARELTTAELRSAYAPRWPLEPHC